ncbi:hypothetical protein MAR_002824 [Mya arenaria]|uniref:Protein quiver n=1 Tax=Mya arenaria TaxID=6604 RepID=A0ABY7G876_MYAAR|nr:protein quiver-like [Mya arenaria]WAR29256.1 hypothetical protein MAR_002824 [Mya arenaria]
MAKSQLVLCILPLFLLVTFAGMSSAIRCYVCDSITNTDCKDPFISAPTQDSCVACGKAKGEVSGAQRVARTCESNSLPDICESDTQFGVDVDACICNGDLCNAATPVSMSTSVLLLPLVIVLLEKLI